MKQFQSRNLKKHYDLGKFAPLYKTNFLTDLKRTTVKGDRFAPIFIQKEKLDVWVAKSFGFCKGVENAIEVAYDTLAENPDKRVFMISELIHNAFVNRDLKARGLQFLKTAKGEELIPWSEVSAEDIVITPAFGATTRDKEIADSIGVDLLPYNATCRFVENVWFRAEELGKQGFTIVVHGKFKHEETQATFSYSDSHAPTVVVRDMEEAKILGEMISGKRTLDEFDPHFAHKASEGFDPSIHFERLAVVNQTTMLASETSAITQHLREAMQEKVGAEHINDHFANTRDTLCYATKNNQEATHRLLQMEADLAIVIGGRNSSNTSHLVELCEEKMPTYFIQSKDDIVSTSEIVHWNYDEKHEETSQHFLPQGRRPRILLTSGASCPDALVEEVIEKLDSLL